MKPLGLSVAEFCRIAPFQKTATYALIREGKLVTTKVNGRRIINFDSATALIAPAKKEGE